MPKYIATAETIATQTESVRRQAERNAARARTVATPKTVAYASDIPVGELTDDQKAELTGKRGGNVLAYFRKNRVPRGLRQWYWNRLALRRAV